MTIKKDKIFNANFAKKLIIFTIGLFIMALGVSLSIKADIGVSPISCVPYVYSLGLPLTVGELTILLNIFFIMLQIAVARKNYNIFQLVQLPAVIVFGYCIDITMYFITNLIPTNYIEQLLLCIIACITLAFGIFLLVKTRLTYLPIEGLVIVLVQTFKLEFGKVKISIDSTMVIVGVLSSFVLLNSLQGIREGSIIAALTVGVLIKFYNTKLPFVEKWISKGMPTPQVAKEEFSKYNNSFVITISREFGSGGHEIGKLIAKELGIAFYDKELIRLTAEQTGYNMEYIQENEQKLTNSLLYDLYEQNYSYVNDELPPKDVLFLIQSKIIRDICAKESCVIVGRCANFILKDHPNAINIFIHANNEYRIDKINNQYKRVPPFTEADLEKSDEQRANYSIHFTKKEWRDATNYHLTIDSSLYGSKLSATRVIEFIKNRIK
ncbi:cytidylate kinase family protein [Halarcobacter ebronensis]|uniref:Cytidylate kinase n=1 Tax=Halarcobacter ebronensis TaxID=1462615 RepID=A0A4V1M0M4_9BACT|nr:cytidylate kinase family protein [Halarcobacter ebronensis]QKF82784.1 putative cytidylate kinase [Halarcobacter ebronensis]RXK06808.1 hypothetical protein CRV07_05090 [Halarcobacter ebronensis]